MRNHIRQIRSVIPRWRVFEAGLTGVWFGALTRALGIRPLWQAALYATAGYVIAQFILSKGAGRGRE